jgi:ABC-type polysaccharide/polyol phosphate export permease
MLMFYADRLSPLLLLLPAIACVQLVFTLGVTVLLSSVNVFFRDLGNVSRHALRLWFYLSPALYSLDQARAFEGLPAPVRTLMELNPFAILFEAYRAVIYGTTTGGPVPPDTIGLASLLGASLGLLGLATIAFKRVEPAFAKVL